ncbi:MAG: phosphate acyltransferase PlsX [Rhodothermales bacterium]|nr:phosphate acyltransferase PlsX [Rhodothermales bacterium]
MPVRVAIDAMGGDNAPEAVIAGAARALKQSEPDVHVMLTGPEDRLRPLVEEATAEAELNLHVVHAPEVIGMDESPASAIKSKQNSSIHVGLGMCREGKADAFCSAGNTGAVMAGSFFILGRQQGVARPSVIGYFPTLTGTSIMLDVGTNVDCKPEHLVQFARMGSVYVQRALHCEQPKVALLNVGEEPGKGDELSKAAHKLLSEADGLNFIGNVEGRDLLMHRADVIVCDGFVGNTLLKFGESVASALPQMLGQEMRRLGMSEDEQAIVARAFAGVRARFDYEEFGGAPLLGVNGAVLIGHGGSGEQAFANMVHAAVELIRENVTESIGEALAD